MPALYVVRLVPAPPVQGAFADIGTKAALATPTNLVARALGRILIPQVLHRLDVDPAVSSSPLVTTVTDVAGFPSFQGIATLWFGLAKLAFIGMLVETYASGHEEWPLVPLPSFRQPNEEAKI